MQNMMKRQKFIKTLTLLTTIIFTLLFYSACDDTAAPLGDIVKIHIEGPTGNGGAAPVFEIHKITVNGVDEGAITASTSPAFTSALDIDVALTDSISEGDYFVIEYSGPSEEITRTYTFYNSEDEIVCTKSHTHDDVIEIVVSTAWSENDEYTEFYHSGNNIKMTQKTLPAPGK